MLDDSRLSWDETWLAIAGTMARRTRCSKRQVGAVIVDPNNRPVATGYNGPPAGYPLEDNERCDSFCERQQKGNDSGDYGLQCPTVHAEANALLFSDRRDYSGGTIYITDICCNDCAKLIAGSGLKRAVMKWGKTRDSQDPTSTVEFLRTCGIVVKIC